MTPLKLGDRVRLKVDCSDRGYRVGEKGTVWSGPHRSADGGLHYYLEMDRQPGGTPIAFRAEEIEPK